MLSSLARRALPLVRTWLPPLLRLGRLPTGVYETINQWQPGPGESLRFVREQAAATTVPGRARHLPGQQHPGFDAELTYVDLRTFVATLSNARVDTRHGFVRDAAQQVFGDVPKVYKGGYTPLRHPLLKALRLPVAEPLPGTSAVLSIYSVNNYYHWMFEALPRLELLRLAGADLRNIDWFIVNDLDNQFVAPSLAQLGIPRDKLKVSRDDGAFLCERLLVPSMPCQTNPSRWVCDFLRAHFRPPAPEAKAQAERLFVSRAPGARRRILNEPEVEAELTRRGFAKVYLEHCSLPEQIARFARAEAVVAVHGASMANLVFCPAGAKVIEMFHPNYVNSCYRAVAQQVGLEYGYLIAEGEYGGVVQDMAHCGDDLQIDLAKLRALLQSMEVN